MIPIRITFGEVSLLKDEMESNHNMQIRNCLLEQRNKCNCTLRFRRRFSFGKYYVMTYTDWMMAKRPSELVEVDQDEMTILKSLEMATLIVKVRSQILEYFVDYTGIPLKSNVTRCHSPQG